MASTSEILGLGDQIQSLTKSLAAESITNEYEKTEYDSQTCRSLKNQLNDALEVLQLLVLGPKGVFKKLQLSHYDLAAFQVALEFELFGHVPLQGEISLYQLSQRVSLGEDRLGRILRVLALQRVFQEVREDVFVHTPSSALMETDKSFRAAVAIQMDEMYQAASSTSEALRKSPFEQTGSLTPFSCRFGVPIYDYYKQHPNKAARFGEAMQGATAFDEESINSLRYSYPWATLGNAKIIDIAGGGGHVSMFLAKHFQNLSFIVQDLFPPSNLGPNGHLADRVSFQEHNMFKEQPITDGNIYFMKHTLHNHSDDDCLKIIRALVPALEKAGPDTPFLINEGVVPVAGEKMARYQELTLRRGDMCMLTTLSAKERTRKQFEELLEKADSRFKIFDIYGDAVTKLVDVRLCASA
ncbi:S-adenosyl-L-methionine-dependent methyltransferase [Phaeosphaeriaceae sp. PMI808]|nr:S-adenosyl-L-methionine-dependent methyltransferase [Phaeosphaeriaceae sp. PMI808]